MKAFTALTLFSTLLTQIAMAAVVEVEVTNFRNQDGQLVVAVFNEAGYPKVALQNDGQARFEPAGAAANCPAQKVKKGRANHSANEVKAFYPITTNPIVFKVDLPPGEYSIGVIHDANLNCKLDGVPPSEGGSFTGGINFFGPKKWKESKFTLPAEGTRQFIKMRYWL